MGTRYLEIVELMESIQGVPGIGGKALDEERQDTVEVCIDMFSGARVGKNYGPIRVALLLNFR